MFRAIEESGRTARLFSSAIFCLWLSIGSVTVWFDYGGVGAVASEAIAEELERQRPQPLPTDAAEAAAQATPASDPSVDAA